MRHNFPDNPIFQSLIWKKPELITAGCLKTPRTDFLWKYRIAILTLFIYESKMSLTGDRMFTKTHQQRITVKAKNLQLVDQQAINILEQKYLPNIMSETLKVIKANITLLKS